VKEHFQNGYRRLDGTVPSIYGLAYVHTDIHTYINTQTHRYIRTYIYIYIYIIHTFICIYTSICMPVCLLKFVTQSLCTTSFLMATDIYVRWQEFSQKKGAIIMKLLRRTRASLLETSPFAEKKLSFKKFHFRGVHFWSSFGLLICLSRNSIFVASIFGQVSVR
jgi:hypothetical protein